MAITKSGKNSKLKNIKQQIPLKELGNTKDISEAVKFLIQNDFMNGKTLNIDGGLTI